MAASPVKSRGLTVLPKIRYRKPIYLSYIRRGKIAQIKFAYIGYIYGKTGKMVRLYIYNPLFMRVFGSYQCLTKIDYGKTIRQKASRVVLLLSE